MSFENLLTRKRRRWRLLTWWERDRRSHATMNYLPAIFLFFFRCGANIFPHSVILYFSYFSTCFYRARYFFQIFFLFWLYNIISINYFQYDMISKCLRLKLFGLNIYSFFLYNISYKHVHIVVKSNLDWWNTLIKLSRCLCLAIHPGRPSDKNCSSEHFSHLSTNRPFLSLRSWGICTLRIWDGVNE